MFFYQRFLDKLELLHDHAYACVPYPFEKEKLRPGARHLQTAVEKAGLRRL